MRGDSMKLNEEKIKIMMAQKQLSSTELANRCSLTRQRISCILNSIHVTPKTAGHIAKALEVDVTEIIETGN